MNTYKFILLFAVLIQEFKNGFCVFQYLLPMWQSGLLSNSDNDMSQIGQRIGTASTEAFENANVESIANINNNDVTSQYLGAPVIEPRQALIVGGSAAVAPVSSQSSIERLRRRLFNNYLSQKTNTHFIGKRDDLRTNNNTDMSSETAGANVDETNAHVENEELSLLPREASFMEKLLDRLSFSKKNANQLKKTCRNSFKERSILPFLIYKCNLIKF
jgi:hypothetical protein